MRSETGKPYAASVDGSGTKGKLMEPTNRELVFISYSHKDKRWLDELVTQLKPYVRQGSIKPWSDEQIQPGSKWPDEIEKALERTRVAVLLVTAHFLASDFIADRELHPLLLEAKRGGLTILWIPVRACAYETTSLKDYQAIISPEKPLAEMRGKRDRAWVKICRAIEDAANILPLTVVHADTVPPRNRRLVRDLKRSMADGELRDSEIAPIVLAALGDESKVELAVGFESKWLIRGIRASDEYFVGVRFGAGEIDWQRDFPQTLAPVLVGLAHSLARSSDAQALLINVCNKIAGELKLRLLWPTQPDEYNDVVNRIYLESLQATELESDDVLSQLKELKVVGPK